MKRLGLLALMEGLCSKKEELEGLPRVSPFNADIGKGQEITKRAEALAITN